MRPLLLKKYCSHCTALVTSAALPHWLRRVQHEAIPVLPLAVPRTAGCARAPYPSAGGAGGGGGVCLRPIPTLALALMRLFVRYVNTFYVNSFSYLMHFDVWI